MSDSSREITTESILAGDPSSPNYLRGIVKISWGKEAGQLPIADARKLGIRLLEAAQAAETDELYVRWLMKKCDMPVNTAVAALQDIRQMREDWLR